MAIDSFRNVQKRLETHGVASLRVFGKSMLPIIRDGDIISIRTLPVEGLKALDIIVFYDPILQKNVCHFFCGTSSFNSERVIYTRGIQMGLLRQDMPVNEKYYLGVCSKKASWFYKVYIIFILLVSRIWQIVRKII